MTVWDSTDIPQDLRYRLIGTTERYSWCPETAAPLLDIWVRNAPTLFSGLPGIDSIGSVSRGELLGVRYRFKDVWPAMLCFRIHQPAFSMV